MNSGRSKFKLRFPQFKHLRPEYATCHQWYMKLQNSSDFHTTNLMFRDSYGMKETPEFVAANVIKVYPKSPHRMFYITIFDELYFTGCANQIPKNKIFIHVIRSRHTYNTPSKIMDHVLDIHFFSDAVLCLNTNGTLTLCFI